MTRLGWRVLGAGVFGLGLMVGSTMPVSSGSSPNVRPQQSQDRAILEAVLGGVRGAHPMACELALMGLDGRGFNWSSVRTDVEGADPGGIPARRLAEWIMRPPRDDASVLPPLRSALAGPDACARRAAARVLGRLRTAAAIDVLLDGLDAGSPDVRHAAAVGLGMAERDATASRLRQALDDPAPPVRAAAAWALGEIEDPAASPLLIRSLAADRDPTVRKAAAWALGRIE